MSIPETGPDAVAAHGELTEVHAQAVLMRAEGATYSRIAEELEISEAEAREYAPFPAQLNAGHVREEMRHAIIMGDRNKLAEAFEQFGLTLGDVLAMQRECIYADRYFFDKDTGRFFAKPDWKTRQTAINSYLRAIGLIGEVAQETDQAKPVEIHMHHNTLVKVEQLTGRKLLKEGEDHDGLDRIGTGPTGGDHLPIVRRFSEPLPEGAAGDREVGGGDADRAAADHDDPSGDSLAPGGTGADRGGLVGPESAAGPDDRGDGSQPGEWGDF